MSQLGKPAYMWKMRNLISPLLGSVWLTNMGNLSHNTTQIQGLPETELALSISPSEAILNIAPPWVRSHSFVFPALKDREGGQVGVGQRDKESMPGEVGLLMTLETMSQR